MLVLFSKQEYRLCGLKKNLEKFYALRNVFSNGWQVCVNELVFSLVFVTSSIHMQLCSLTGVCLGYDSLCLLEQRATFYLTL